MLSKDGKECSLKFGNILVFCADTYLKSVLLSPWDEELRSPFQLGTQRNLLIYNAIGDICICMTKLVIYMSYIYAFVQEFYTHKRESFKLQVRIRVFVMIIEEDILLIMFVMVRFHSPLHAALNFLSLLSHHIDCHPHC